jgi:hypothetical protein
MVRQTALTILAARMIVVMDLVAVVRPADAVTW